MCAEHLFTLTDKGIPTFEVEAYQYLESQDNYLQHLQRKERVETGLRNIALLENRCDVDLREVQRLLKIGKTSEEQREEAFETICAQAQRCCDAMKKRLSETSIRLRELIKEQSCELSAEDTSVCELADVGPLFTLVQRAQGVI